MRFWYLRSLHSGTRAHQIDQSPWFEAEKDNDSHPWMNRSKSKAKQSNKTNLPNNLCRWKKIKQRWRERFGLSFRSHQRRRRTIGLLGHYHFNFFIIHIFHITHFKGLNVLHQFWISAPCHAVMLLVKLGNK